MTAVDPGNTKQTGATFTYRLTYNCSSTSGPCLNAQVVDLLPAEVQYVSTVPASATGDVAAINVTPNFGGSGRTRVQFVMVTPLTAGNSGDLLVNVRFPNGTTPNGTVATNTADGINLDTTPGTFTTPPVSVTAVATFQTTTTKTLQTAPANLDLPESYRLRISVPNSNGALGMTAIGPIVDTLPPGTVFNGATPAADCQPGCVGTTPATVTWTGPCTVPLNPGGNCDITVNVTFPSGTFASGTNVTNSFTGTGTPLGGTPTALPPGSVTHPVTTFVPAPGLGIGKAVNGNSANPPTLNQNYTYDLTPTNSGNVPLDTLVMIDTLPVQFQLLSATTGAYNNLAPFAAGEGVRVSYEKNTAPGTFTLWGSSPNVTTSTTLTSPPPGLSAGEYVTRIRWEYGAAAVGMGASSNANRPQVTGRIVNPDNAGNPVAVGANISNCVAVTATYTAGPTAVNNNTCRNFTLSGPFVQFNPAKDNLSGGGPFNPGQAIAWRLRVRSAAQSSDPMPLASLTASDLLPVDLSFVSWTFDDQGSGLPAPQVFQQIPNYAGTGRTLLRWKWNAGSGNLGVNSQVWINISTTVRSGAASGTLTNTLSLNSDAPGLGQRCSAANRVDTLDLDGDGNTSEQQCSADGTANIAPIAQLVSSKQTQSVCDATFGSAGQTLPGGQLRYKLNVQNVGTVAMQNFVLIDILPAVGDTGVRDTNPRGSQWQPQLAAPIVPPAGTVLYYSTALNPCRGEVGGPTLACAPPNWSTVPPEPLSAARSFKVEFGSRVIGPFDTLSFDFSMSAPANIPAGSFAYNSFAYQGDRSDGLGSLAAEPQKVGVTTGTCPAASLGDFVWMDTNNDGQQDDGPTGRNGVSMTLYEAGADGVVGTLDDLPLQHAITQNGPGGAAGWYRFLGLAAGKYRVCAVLPPNTLPATPDVGNDTTDSDGHPTTHCTPSTTLALNEDNPTLDFGLVPTAALGNYVWFDRNGNGVQDESPFDGANGVTVQLYADNGDGTPNVASDALVATTVTAPDAFGFPGYYLFQNLVPGQGYFVRFVRPASATAFTTANAGANDAVDSDANVGTGTTPAVALLPGEFDGTIDAGLVVAAGTLALGDQVWLDTNNNGSFEPQNGETGIDNVRLSLYRDANNDGVAQPDEYAGQTATVTTSGFSGRYRFGNLAAGAYIVVVEPSNFGGGNALGGLTTATGNDPAPDPDNDVNGDDNGRQDGAQVVALAVTLTANGEPTSEDGDANTNLTVDFGFIAGTPPHFDYGDAPDAGAGTGAGNYGTVAFDNGPVHLLGVPGAPYLGDCVDADDGTAQNATADADDTTGATFTVGTCAQPGHDEDGVTFAGAFVPGSTASIQVRAGTPATCHLDAWIDFNGNGVFTDAGEQIAANVTIAAGTTAALSPAVPANAIPGRTYARFRCSSSGALSPVGAAADGEVEDYAITIDGRDFGDAPASYGTQGAGAAGHDVKGPNPLLLGQCVDLDVDGQPNASATGDDAAAGSTRYGLCFGDEDGVVFTPAVNPIVACGTTNLSVTASAPGKLDAFVDFNGDGDFNDAGEKIFNGTSLVAGANSLSFPVACSVTPGQKYLRFRLSTAGGLGPTGNAPDGEVEDYAVTAIGADFGDAPAPFPTLLANDGARHGAVPGFALGATEDTEPDGQPTAPADGDGADEDGVAFPGPLDACTTQSLTITLTNTAGIAAPKLDAWIDFNRDGDWSDAGEQVATSQALVAGSNTLTVNVPCAVNPGATYARFRLSSAGALAPTGATPDGEVEDYVVTLRGADFGDAPDTYHTTIAAGGAIHRVDTTSKLYLGACVDTELDGQPNAGATGDDAGAGTSTAGVCAGGDDEDGIVFATPLAACRAASITVTAGAAGQFDGWIDFNGNGVFDAAERVFDHQAIAAGAQSLSVNVPCSAVAGATYARFRLSSTGTSGPAGVANDGEVEDYPISIRAVDYGDAPDSYGTSSAASGPTHVIDPLSSLYLGQCVDGEANGAPSVNAAGDDAAAGYGRAGTCGGAGDEDGVLFTTPVTACNSANVSVTAGAAGRLDAWIDFNDDGDFNDAGEQIFTSQALNAGANALSFGVPCTSVGGNLYSRFRFSTAGGLAPTGPAADGEVEDHLILGAQQADFGDAPDSYRTRFASGGPRHGVGSGSTLFLGACVDGETDAAGPLDASDDDVGSGGITAGTCTGNDDEDGVVFATPLVACTTATVAVTASQAGKLDAWIDFDRDGTFADPAERIATGQALAAGVNNLGVNVPCSAIPGASYARFRISSTGGLSVGGPAVDGEVEDHPLLLKTTDWGDAPDTYGTTIAANGARHGVLAGFSLGASVDGETDGQPNALADGDGADEDGVTFTDGTQFVACATQNLSVALTNGAGVQTPRLDAWIDFDGDGRFDDPRDRVAAGLALASGANSVAVNVPCNIASHTTTYARFRLSSGTVTAPTGGVLDGEVEDYRVSTAGQDYGDAPDTYGTTLAANGARHHVLGTNNPQLGATEDTEADGQPATSALGDDANGDDEDGAVFPATLIPGAPAHLSLTAGATGGLVDAWIDFDRNGTFDAGDRIATSYALAAGQTATLDFTPPATSAPGATYARVRISSAGGLGPTGVAPDGEVEDYAVAMGQPQPMIGLAKRVVASTSTGPTNYRVTYELYVVNSGNVPLVNLSLTDDLGATFALAANFAVASVTSSDFTLNPAYNGRSDTQLLGAGNALPIGGTGRVRVAVDLVLAPAYTGPFNNTAHVGGDTPPGGHVDDDSTDGVSTDPNGNGDPTDDDTPTVVRFNAVPVPAAAGPALMLLAALLLALGVRRRRA